MLPDAINTPAPKKVKKKPRVWSSLFLAVALYGFFVGISDLAGTIVSPYVERALVEPVHVNTQRAMSAFSVLYEKYGEALTREDVPFLLSSEQAMKAMSSQSAFFTSAENKALIASGDFHIIGQKGRFMVVAVEEAECVSIALETGTEIAEVDSVESGLVHMARHSGDGEMRCYQQGWREGVSSLFSSLILGMQPSEMSSYIAYRALPVPGNFGNQI